MKSPLVSALEVILLIFFPLVVFGQSEDPYNTPGKVRGGTKSREALSGSKDPVIQDMVNNVSTDAIISTLRNLQGFGTRYEFSPQREACATWLLNQYQQLGLEAHAEPYTFITADLTDIDFVNDSCAYIVGSHDLLARTTNGGASWNQIAIGTSVGIFDAVDFIDEQRGWVVGGFGSCFRTTDAGRSWTGSTIAAGVFHAVAFLDSMNGLVAGQDGAILRTTNGGSTWLRCAVSVGNIGLHELKVIDAQHSWAVGDSGVILASHDAGLTWARQSSPVNDPIYDVDFVDGLNGWAVGGKGYYSIGKGEGSLLKTTDGGQTWKQLGNPSEAYCLGGVYAVDSIHVWVTDPRGKLFLSADGGDSWQMKLDLIADSLRRFAGRIRGYESSRIGFIGMGGLLYISGDGGISWEDRALQLPADVIHRSSNIVATIPGEVTPDREFLLLAHYDSRSTASMTSAPGINDNGSGTSLVLEAARVCSGHRFASTLRFLALSAEELGLIGSSSYARAMLRRKAKLIGAINTDMVGFPVAGDSLRLVVASYQTPNALQDSVALYQARYGIDAHLVVAVDSTPGSDHVSFSQAGYTAVCLSEGTAQEVVHHDPYLHTTGDTLGNLRPGMVRRATQLAVATAAEFAGPLVVSGVHHDPVVPEEFSLWQNYPNPFNPSTTIRYEVPKSSVVSLKIFNTLGQEVEVLVNEHKESGSFQVQWNSVNLPSGIYFYRLHAGQFVETKKMILLK